VKCEVIEEKILAVGERRSIVKTFFEMEVIQNIGIAIAIALCTRR
jgi:hypothetical protein